MDETVISQEKTRDTVVRRLIAEGITISAMESVTSGLISSMLTDTEGASSIFPGGYVTYSNEEKIQAGVSRDVIEVCGVYSPECAHAMAEAAQKHFKTRLAIGITGSTGNPDPANSDSTPGVAYFCILLDDMAYEEKVALDVTGKTRHEIKQLYADAVFTKLNEIILWKINYLRQ